MESHVLRLAGSPPVSDLELTEQTGSHYPPELVPPPGDQPPGAAGTCHAAGSAAVSSRPLRRLLSVPLNQTTSPPLN